VTYYMKHSLLSIRRVISSIINRNFFVTRNKQPLTIVRWLTRAIQKYKFQYNNIYSSTTIFLYIPVHKCVFQYNNVYSSTDSIPVQNYKFRYRNIFEYENISSSTEIYVLVQKHVYIRLQNYLQVRSVYMSGSRTGCRKHSASGSQTFSQPSANNIKSLFIWLKPSLFPM